MECPLSCYVPLALNCTTVLMSRRRPLLEILANQAPHRNEVKKLIAVTLQGRQDLDRLLAREATKR